MNALRPIEQILLRYLDQEAPVFFAVVDRAGAILRSNAFVRELTGQAPPPQALQEVLVDFRNQLDLPALSREPAQRHRFHVNTFTGLPQTFYFHFFEVGEEIVVLGQTDMAELERLRHTLVVMNNDLNNLTRALQRQAAELKQLNEWKNQFLAMANHDLRKPVSAVRSYSELLLAGRAGELNPRQRQFLEIIGSSSELMGSLVENFLDLAVIESGMLKLQLQPSDLPALIQRSIALNSPVAQRRQVQVLVQSAGPVPPVPLDRFQIEQVLNNLLANAVEHSPANGKVFIRVTLSEETATVTVTDQGEGIRPEEMAGLFQPFGQARRRKSSGAKSTGLGLTIAKKIVDAHHGQLWVESRPELGTTFGFSLPRRAEGAG